MKLRPHVILRILAVMLGVVIVVLLGVLIFANPAKSPTEPTHPPLVSTDGSVSITSPASNALIASPVTITGSAVGNWYFEASFPVKVLDGDGTVLGQAPAQAQGEWMTTSSVPFSAVVSFATPRYATGTVLFHNDNPSGLSQYDKEFSISVRFR